jgi:hypothetical protein
LPALSLPANDNAISWATAWYANSLAGFIANSQPRIKTVFDSWKAAGGTKETFLSQLEKNQDVKNILLSESPWVLEATTEAEQQARIATLFDINQLNNRNLSAFTKLKELQGEDGGWSWYKGMSGSRYITGYITELLVRLPLLTKNEQPEEVAAMRQKAFGYLNRQALEEYRNIRKSEKNGARITVNSEAAMTYLYLIAVSGGNQIGSARELPGGFLAIGATLEDNAIKELKEETLDICRQHSAIIGKDVYLIKGEEKENKKTYSLDNLEYKYEEYLALSGKNKIRGSKDFLIEEMDISKYDIPGVSQVVLVKKLKEIQVLVGFSRLQPISVADMDDPHFVSIKQE